MAKGDGDRKENSSQVRSEIQELSDKGFSQKEIFALFYQRARWRLKLKKECLGEPTPPAKRSKD